MSGLVNCRKQRLQATYHSNAPASDNGDGEIYRPSNAGMVEDSPVKSQDGEFDHHQDKRVSNFSNEESKFEMVVEVLCVV